MMLSPALRRFAFAAHVTASVGWLGAVMVFIARAGVGLTSRDEVTVRGAYLVMAPAAWLVLVPLAHASFVSGVALSLGTAWGLFRHYWGRLQAADHRLLNGHLAGVHGTSTNIGRPPVRR